MEVNLNVGCLCFYAPILTKAKEKKRFCDALMDHRQKQLSHDVVDRILFTYICYAN